MPDMSFYLATILNLAVNLTYTVLALIVGIVTFRTLDRYIFRDIDFVDEIKKGNMAAALFASTMLIFIAIVIGLALRS